MKAFGGDEESEELCGTGQETILYIITCQYSGGNVANTSLGAMGELN